MSRRRRKEEKSQNKSRKEDIDIYDKNESKYFEKLLIQLIERENNVNR
jgi:hypothetical protein